MRDDYANWNQIKSGSNHNMAVRNRSRKLSDVSAGIGAAGIIALVAASYFVVGYCGFMIGEHYTLLVNGLLP